MRILLAIDGSKYSETAAQAVSSEFRTEGTEVLVLQVVEPVVYAPPPQMAQGYAPELQDDEAEQRRKQREAPVQRLEHVIEEQRHSDVERVRDEVDGVNNNKPTSADESLRRISSSESTANKRHLSSWP